MALDFADASGMRDDLFPPERVQVTTRVMRDQAAYFQFVQERFELFVILRRRVDE
jgi:hypothetical protein